MTELCEYELSLDPPKQAREGICSRKDVCASSGGSIHVPPSNLGIGKVGATALRPVEQIPKPLLGKE
jgi:hypothetical protein